MTNYKMGFKKNVIASFQNARSDMESLKENVGEWLSYLRRRDDDLQNYVYFLERRIENLEKQLNYAYQK